MMDKSRSHRVRNRQMPGAMIVLLLALILPACGGGVSSGAGGSSAEGAAAGGMERAGGAEFAVSGGEKIVSGAATAESGAQAAAGTATTEDQVLPEDFDRKIVKTAELGIQAGEVRESAAEAQRVAASYGGSVLSSRVSRSGGPVYADLTLSVPSSDFEAALDDLRGLGEKVTTDAVRGEDVTEEFVDLESRERNLLAAEESLLALYEKAESVEDTLTVQRELTNVRGEIELVQGRLKYLEERTALSRITLAIEPTPSPGPPPSAWDPADVAARAWNASIGVLQGFATAAISALVFGWWLFPALVAGLILWRRHSHGSEAGTGSPPAD